MNTHTYILAGGGTGGHLYPGIAVAKRLVEIQPDSQVVYACSDRRIDSEILSPLAAAMVPQSVVPIPGRPSPKAWLKFLRCWLASSAQARDMIRDLRPAAVLGLGGFAAGPVVRAAARRGVPTALLNPDAVPGKANKYLSGHVRAIFTQFDSTARHFAPRVASLVQAVGCPIRPGLVGAGRQEALEALGLRSDRKVLLVFGGSLLAASLPASVAAMSAKLAPLADRWQLCIVSNSPDAASQKRTLEQAGLAVALLPYCQRMEQAYAAADLAITRGGAVTIAELAATGTPAVVLPYPHHKDQQQRLNAAELVSAGAALLVDDRDPITNARELAGIMLPVVADDAKLSAMRQAALSLARPDAAMQVARWLVSAGQD